MHIINLCPSVASVWHINLRKFAIIRVKIKNLAAKISLIFENPKLIIPFFHFIPSNNAFLSFSLPMIAKKSLSLQQKITSK